MAASGRTMVDYLVAIAVKAAAETPRRDAYIRVLFVLFFRVTGARFSGLGQDGTVLAPVSVSTPLPFPQLLLPLPPCKMELEVLFLRALSVFLPFSRRSSYMVNAMCHTQYFADMRSDGGGRGGEICLLL